MKSWATPHVVFEAEPEGSGVRNSPLPPPSPLAGECRGEGKKIPLSHLCPIHPRRHARTARANEKRDSSLQGSSGQALRSEECQRDVQVLHFPGLWIRESAAGWWHREGLPPHPRWCKGTSAPVPHECVRHCSSWPGALSLVRVYKEWIPANYWREGQEGRQPLSLCHARRF